MGGVSAEKISTMVDTEKRFLRKVGIAAVVGAFAVALMHPQSVVAFDPRREIGNCFSGGCDLLWKANQRFDAGIRSKTQAMAEGVRVEFEKAMDDLFVTHIQPTIKEIDGITAKRVAEVDALVDDALERVDQIVDRAATVAEKFPQNIRDNIIREAGKEAAEFRKALIADAYALIDKVQCALDGSVDNAAANLRSLIPDDPFEKIWAFRDNCYYKDGNFAGVPSADEWVSIYDVKSCKLLRDIDGANTSVDTIIKTYIQLQALAQRTRCVLKVDAAQDFYGREYLKWGAKYDFWTKISAP